MTLAFVPTSTATNTSTLAVTTTSATPVGAYPIVIRGNTAGLAEQTVNLTVNVTAAGGEQRKRHGQLCGVHCGQQAGMVCLPGRHLRRLDPGDGSERRVPVQHHPEQGRVRVRAAGDRDLDDQCPLLHPGGADRGTVRPLLCRYGEDGECDRRQSSGGQQAFVSFGAGFTSTLANGQVALINVLDGSHDVVAYAGAAFLGPAATDRVFLARGLNPVNGGSLGTLDFTGSGSSVVGSASMTLAGGVGGEIYSQAMTYQTGATCDPAPLYQSGTFAGSPFTTFGVAAANQATTDFHRLTVTAISGTTSLRFVSESFKVLAGRTLTLPSVLGTVTVTNAGWPLQADDGGDHSAGGSQPSAVATYADNTAEDKAGTIIASAGWLGGLAVSLTLPDFSAVAGVEQRLGAGDGGQPDLDVLRDDDQSHVALSGGGPGRELDQDRHVLVESVRLSEAKGQIPPLRNAQGVGDSQRGVAGSRRKPAWAGRWAKPGGFGNCLRSIWLYGSRGLPLPPRQPEGLWACGNEICSIHWLQL